MKTIFETLIYTVFINSEKNIFTLQPYGLCCKAPWGTWAPLWRPQM